MYPKCLDHIEANHLRNNLSRWEAPHWHNTSAQDQGGRIHLPKSSRGNQRGQSRWLWCFYCLQHWSTPCRMGLYRHYLNRDWDILWHRFALKDRWCYKPHHFSYKCDKRVVWCARLHWEQTSSCYSLHVTSNRHHIPYLNNTLQPPRFESLLFGRLPHKSVCHLWHNRHHSSNDKHSQWSRYSA